MKSLIATVSLLALVGAAPAVCAQTTQSPPSLPGHATAVQLNQQDQHFVRQAAIGGMTEVEMGKLAEQRAADPAVRVFGRWMATDHTLVGTMLTNIAQHDGLSPPQSLDQQHQAMVQKLQGLQGASFDQAYIPMQVKAHQQTIALFQNEAKSGANPRLRTFATRLVPTLQQHLAAAEELEKLPAIASSSGRNATVGSGSSMPPRGSNAMTRHLNRQELNSTTR